MQLAKSLAVNNACMYEHNTAHAAAIIYPKSAYLLLVAQMYVNAISRHCMFRAGFHIASMQLCLSDNLLLLLNMPARPVNGDPM